MSWFRKAGLAAAAFVAATLPSAAQPMPDPHPQMMQGGHGGPGGMMDRHGAMHRQGEASAQPTLPGQDAFGAIQEVVGILEADPDTDWSKVDIGALREHLIDMNEVTLHAKAEETSLADGVEIAVTGDGRTRDAIRRMIPAHARELDGLNGWSAKAVEAPNGIRLTVTGADATQARKIRALGFMGLMVQGGHHQPHHLLIAKGEFRHR
jgi:hypothetical protein